VSRHARQIRLAEVGTRGQARIAAAIVAVPLSSAEARVAVRYLAGAGVGVLRVNSALLVDEAHAVDPSVRVEIAATSGEGLHAFHDPFADLDPAAGDIARGAAFALAELRRVLGVDA
jgi:hypothetical protein